MLPLLAAVEPGIDPLRVPFHGDDTRNYDFSDRFCRYSTQPRPSLLSGAARRPCAGQDLKTSRLSPQASRDTIALPCGRVSLVSVSVAMQGRAAHRDVVLAIFFKPHGPLTSGLNPMVPIMRPSQASLQVSRAA
jgi:hypothetical protein